jgi:hypothetical protein
MLGSLKRRSTAAPTPLLYFAHIPKTGGTSIRAAALKHFGQAHCASIYARDHVDGVKRASELYFEALDKGLPPRKAARMVVKFCKDQGIQFLTTHDNIAFKHAVSPKRCFGILREPVARLLSHYNYDLSRGLEPAPFEEFAFISRLKNIQARSFIERRLDEVGLICVQEHFEASVAAINKVFDLSLKPLERNRTKTVVGHLRRQDLDRALIARIEAHHDRDMALYEARRTAFEKAWT